MVKWRGWKQAAALMIVVGFATSGIAEAATKRIAITQIASHPGIDAIRQGFLDEVKRLGYEEGRDVLYEFSNANGDMPTAQSIAQKIARDEPDLVFAITTPSSQTLAKVLSRSKTPLVFGAVTDPVAAGLVKSLKEPGGNITGTSDQWPVGEQLDLLRQLVPSARRIGVIHNPGETNSAANMVIVRDELKKRDLILIEVAVANTNEVLSGVQSLVGKADAIYVPASNTVVSAMSTVIKAAEQNRIPVLPGVSSSVEVGGVGTIGPDYRDIGVQSARIADRVLKGEPAGTIPVAVAQRFEYYFNIRSAKAMRVSIPENLLAKAVKVYE